MKDINVREIAEKYYCSLPEPTEEYRKSFVQSCIVKVEQMQPEDETEKFALLVNIIIEETNRNNNDLFIKLVEKIVEEIKE